MKVQPARTGPNQYIKVEWCIPVDEVQRSSFDARGAMAARHHIDWVGLYRARTRIDTCDGSILQREVEGMSRLDPNTGLVHGSLRLRTPRGVGQYNFRYFKGEGGQGDPLTEQSMPVARSNTVHVEVQGADMFEALDFVRKNLSDRRKLSNATMQFATLIRQLHTLRRPLMEGAHGGSNGGNNFGGAKRGGGAGGNRRGGGQSGGSDTQAQESRQEAALYREMLQIIRACISHVQRRCDDLTAAIDNEASLLHDRRVQFDKINTYKEKVREEGLAKRLAERGGEPLTADDLEQCGLLNEADFNDWRHAKDLMLSKERSVGQNVRDRATLASSLRGVLDAFLHCKAIQSLVKPKEHDEMEALLSLYCPVDENFFASTEEMQAHYASDLGLDLRSPFADLRTLPKLPAARLEKINVDSLRFVESVMPSPETEQTRKNFVDELQNVVNQTSVMWGCDAKLVPFGSSVNNFGAENSDLDICLVLMPSGARWPDAFFDDTPSEQLGAPPATKAVEDLAATLSENGFEDVDDSRKSARIPILQFRHGPMELECDICVDNRLAVRNTLLLRTYSLIDPRVRQLAYVVKTWAKRRKINNPAERTLSSYGYILMVIHYLQQLETPLLPPLQALPPTWAGEPIKTSLDGSNDADAGMDGDDLDEDGNGASDLPVVLVQSNSEGAQQDTYFFADPQSAYFSTPADMSTAMKRLSAFAARNKDSLADLLVGFFWTMALKFDWRRHVIGVRDAHLVTKESKASEDSWKLHQRMAIEDPFETSYDVAHVVRDREFRLIREEFVRAYALLAAASPRQEADSLDDVIALLCTPSESAQTDGAGAA
ncbi:PolyA RNA polymerase cid13 [Hondaea fermentalgiana]|uniref:PolyA RNA polymerase cid13 n=1 Tax=Hondaea fermentalgiana TaxID=2315210 RepID=A0A2R5G0B3_9STRA|nr:PolyA RNA polymerase cid13 [Hondaea fermentalgiana]|eukprot:GBG24452.1 PolyA RNA polymerase cid13 [Hondaea fermentalgiana]